MAADCCIEGRFLEVFLSDWYVEKRELVGSVVEVPDLVGGTPSSAKCLAAGKCLSTGGFSPSDMDPI